MSIASLQREGTRKSGENVEYIYYCVVNDYSLLSNYSSNLSSKHRDEFSAAFIKVCFHPLFVRMILERECL